MNKKYDWRKFRVIGINEEASFVLEMTRAVTLQLKGKMQSKDFIVRPKNTFLKKSSREGSCSRITLEQGFWGHVQILFTCVFFNAVMNPWAPVGYFGYVEVSIYDGSRESEKYFSLHMQENCMMEAREEESSIIEKHASMI